MTLLTFDDVLIKPKFSTLTSRKQVDLSVNLGAGGTLKLPILSSNMDTVTGHRMAAAMAEAGGLGILHRFYPVLENVRAYSLLTPYNIPAGVSVGLGDEEIRRASELYAIGARVFVLDVAHGAQLQVAAMYEWLKALPGTFVIVGNFATGESFLEFLKYSGPVDAVKVGIGPGSACTTRIKTGVGVPQLSAIQDVAVALGTLKTKPLLVADGGMRTSGDIAKALAGGADLVMLGGMLAGTDETPGESMEHPHTGGIYKTYRGSASKSSYVDQGKDESWRSAEGEEMRVRCKGPVKAILEDIEGGLRSALTYVGAKNLKEFKEKAEFVRVSTNSVKENSAHGKTEV